MKIGICGTGSMGSCMAERLMEVGRDIVVWNRTAEKTKPLVDQGASLAENPADLVAKCDVVLSMLIDDEALDEVYTGENGLLSAELKDKLIIEMSTVSPGTDIRLGKAVIDQGGSFVECPVGGSVGPARQGQLLGLAGGAPADFEKASPILEQLCRRFEHVGGLGAGAAMKLAVNLPLGVYWEALGEALSLAKAAGIDTDLAGSIMADTSGTIKVGPMRIPWVVDELNGTERPEAGFHVGGAAKDLRLMMEYGAENGIDMPATKAARDTYDAAAADGWESRDFALAAAWRVMQMGKGK